MGYSKTDILLIDNRDSFTYNLVHVFKALEWLPKVVDSSTITVNEALKFQKIIFSPGPGIPSDFPIMGSILKKMSKNHHILGICLGHQAIAIHYGAQLYRQDLVQHGQQKRVIKTMQARNSAIFRLPDSFEVGLYHSWAVDPKSIPECLHITCVSEDSVIMGLKHKLLNIEGVQFHPESFMTKIGIEFLRNWAEG